LEKKTNEKRMEFKLLDLRIVLFKSNELAKVQAFDQAPTNFFISFNFISASTGVSVLMSRF
jgi:hypothetical protein